MIEVAAIFEQHGRAFCKQYPQPSWKLRAMRAIENCRTSRMGGHVDECTSCGHLKISYNSCRNRHCPKCQSLAKEQWLADRRRDLLPTSYFHVVFTLPSELHDLALRCPEPIYKLLFQASAQTLQELAQDRLGIRVGFISILHTWGQNMMLHPHVHCVVTGGGLTMDNTQWTAPKGQFFLPVKVMSALFRGKFLHGLKQIRPKLLGVETDSAFRELLRMLYGKNWVVYCKPPFRHHLDVLQYLGRYTHKIAISNHRIQCLQDGKVTFSWRDYKDQGRVKLMMIEAAEFIRRFMLHILPPHFVKIRHYGLLGSRGKKQYLQHARDLLGVTKTQQIPNPVPMSWQERLLQLTGKDVTCCPTCKTGKMVELYKFPPNHSPPEIQHFAS